MALDNATRADILCALDAALEYEREAIKRSAEVWGSMDSIRASARAASRVRRTIRKVEAEFGLPVQRFSPFAPKRKEMNG